CRCSLGRAPRLPPSGTAISRVRFAPESEPRPLSSLRPPRPREWGCIARCRGKDPDGAGLSFDPRRYRNRVQYGSKVVVRLGRDRVVAMDIPTGAFLLEPSPALKTWLDSKTLSVSSLK